MMPPDVEPVEALPETAGSSCAAIGIVVALIVGIMIGFLLAPSARATWKPEYAQLPQEVRDWYRTRTLTEAAQRRFQFRSCCDHADVVKTKFRAGASDEWWWLNGDRWQRVPPDIIHWNQSAPGGEPVLFAVGGQPVCFFPPNGGI